MAAKRNPQLVLALGTRVVLQADRALGGEAAPPPGTVGQIVRASDGSSGSYRVRFPDGSEASFARDDLVILQQYGDAPGQIDDDLRGHVVYRCIVGSRAYGLDRADSDTDVRGIYLPPAERHWSLMGVPEQLEDDERQECFWEIQKFIQLALRSNPNVLECLWTTLVEHAEPPADELRAQRGIFLSKLAYQTYSGYALAQFKRLANAHRAGRPTKWKQAMHLVRLLLAGRELVRSGEVLVDVGEYRSELLAVRDGERTWEEVEAWRTKLHAEIEGSLERTPLPERPDYATANALLVRARRLALDR